MEAANYEIHVAQARAKAKAIEHEAELILSNSNIKVKEAELEAKRKYEDRTITLKKEHSEKMLELEKKERTYKEELKKITKDREDLQVLQTSANALFDEGQQLKEEYTSKVNEALMVLERSAGLTQNEAKEIVLAKVEEQSRAEIAHTVRRLEEEAKQDIKRRVNYILAQATTRFAGEFAAERLINVVNIKDDELKGRIIGKEGRNIKTLEMLLGVDIIIDDTPNTITVSSFNLYRRAVATKTIRELLEDGRIQPARIEEIYKKVKSEFDKNIQKEGEDVVMELGIKTMHPELIKLVGRLRYRASYGQNALAHTLEVAHLSGLLASQMGGDAILARRAGLLHDIGKALTHEAPGSHVDLGAEICKRYDECDTVINAIYAHHGHEEPINVESAAVCAADALSAARPGARREVLESFLKRVEEVENISTSKLGVLNAYAINAGREVRVIVKAELVNDDEAVLLATEIAKEIEEKVQYPGEIKVNVIRETRAESYAR